MLDALLVKYKITAYLFGYKHSLAYTKLKNVMYFMSGAGGKDSKACGGNILDLGGIYGFTRAQVSETAAIFEFFDSSAKVLFTVSGSPRLRLLNAITI